MGGLGFAILLRRAYGGTEQKKSPDRSRGCLSDRRHCDGGRGLGGGSRGLGGGAGLGDVGNESLGQLDRTLHGAAGK